MPLVKQTNHNFFAKPLTRSYENIAAHTYIHPWIYMYTYLPRLSCLLATPCDLCVHGKSLSILEYMPALRVAAPNGLGNAAHDISPAPTALTRLPLYFCFLYAPINDWSSGLKAFISPAFACCFLPFDIHTYILYYILFIYTFFLTDKANGRPTHAQLDNLSISSDSQAIQNTRQRYAPAFVVEPKRLCMYVCIYVCIGVQLKRLPSACIYTLLCCYVDFAFVNRQ